MLTGKMVRVRTQKNKIVPQYLEVTDPAWVEVAARLLALFRTLDGATREELETAIVEAVGENPTQLIHQGLAKLLEDRCDFEIQADTPPEAIREKLFLATAAQRSRNASEGTHGFDRRAILEQVAAETGLSAEVVEQSIFADLKGEQRIRRFRDMTVEQLLHRYNEALVQAVLLRATGLSIKIDGETPQRYRQLFRAIKFHRLIAEIQSSGPGSYLLQLDGPMSLFRSTSKYGLQLALFLPHLLPCKQFELTARVRWGTKRVEKLLTLSSRQGLRSHLPDTGDYLPAELRLFADSFRKSVEEWELLEETAILPVGGHLWTPDFQLRHRRSAALVYLEVFGFWRSSNVQAHLQRLHSHAGVPFLLAVGEQLNIEEADPESAAQPHLYRFKRTPLPAEVARMASALLNA